MRDPESFFCVVGYPLTSLLQGLIHSPRVTMLKYHREMGINMHQYSRRQYNNDNREYCNHPQQRH